MYVTWLDPQSIIFPPVEQALTEPNGLLAAGGDLEPERLLKAYDFGIFPWYEEGQPILWWSPTPRMVLVPAKFRTSRSLRKTLRKNRFEIRIDTAFEAVVRACAKKRDDQQGTWITADMLTAYCRLHSLGHAHSFECWEEDELVGGLYGVARGKVFFGESMFSRTTDASKVALSALARQLRKWDFSLIDCQVSSDHLCSLGAEEISRSEFAETLRVNRSAGETDQPWKLDLENDDID